MSDVSTAETIPAARLQVGDEITLPGATLQRCRVTMVRSAAPGVVWLYLADSLTGERLRGHVELPFDRTVVRHRAEEPAATDRFPEDS